ncbi:nitroreductase family protein [Labrys neptuniae]|uniref:Nitroreductase family protein n=1 Tax=Labrys neptuniae TaxID=376174 RepID=A0ABV3PGW2_9HYPH
MTFLARIPVAEASLIEAHWKSTIESRVSANHFDPSHVLSDAEIGELVRLATLAPSAYNLQNWRFIVVRERPAKERLRAAAYGQAKVSEAAVTFIVCGTLAGSVDLGARLRPSVEAGLMPAAMAEGWVEAVRRQFSGNAQAERDEAIRSASLAAAMLILAASASGLASGPMTGFDAEAVRAAFGLQPDEVPVMLVAVGRAADGNGPQKPRRPLEEVMVLS